MSVRILTDSTAYLPPEDIERYGIRVISLILVEPDRQEEETSIDFGEFYHRLARVDYLPTTAQPSPKLLRAEFERILDEGDECFALFLPSSFSGTFQTAHMVADQIKQERPDARIAIAESCSLCMQQGFAVLAAAECAEAGGSLEDCVAAASDNAQRTRFTFAPRTLTYLERGGRIGRASSLIGGLLKLVPVLTVEQALTTVYSKVRTYPKALMAIKDKLVSDIHLGGGLKRICVHTIAETEQAEAFCKNVIEPLVGFAVRMIPVGPVVGAHVGPAVGIVYETKNAIPPLHNSVLPSLPKVELPKLGHLSEHFGKKEQ